jgi:tight adherence protein B
MQLARSVRAGAPLSEAISQVCESDAGSREMGLEVVGSALQRGVSLDGALVEWGRLAKSRPRLPDVDLIVAAGRFGNRHGGDLASALEAVALTVMDRAELADETAALSSQARASAVVLCLLPVLGAATLCLADPEVAGVLFGTTLGWICIMVAFALDALAAVLGEALIRRALR